MPKRRSMGIMVAAALLALAAAPAGADVTVERFTKSSGFAGIGAHEATAVEKYSGLRKREVSTTKFSGGGGLGSLLSKVAGDMGGDTITDIGRDAVWRLDHQKKTYTEQPIALPQGSEPGGGVPGGATQQEEQEGGKPTHRIVRNEVTVEETGETRRIGEFDCTRYVVTWVLETEDLETKERGESRMVTDLWTTPETGALRALRKEETEFSRAYLKKIGLDLSDQKMQQFGIAAVAAMFGGEDATLEKGAKEVAAKMEKIKGFPVGTKVVWRVKRSGTLPGGVEQEQQGGVADLGKSLDSLLSRFGKKKAKEPEPAAEPAKEGRPAFESYTEIRSVKTDAIPDAEFSVPAGYTKLTP